MVKSVLGDVKKEAKIGVPEVADPLYKFFYEYYLSYYSKLGIGFVMALFHIFMIKFGFIMILRALNKKNTITH